MITKTCSPLFIAGSPNSGKTLLGKCLNEHAQLAHMKGRSRFFNDALFQEFPQRLFECKATNQPGLLKAFKVLAQTRYFWYYRDSVIRKSYLSLWQGVDKVWARRFSHPESFFWNSALGNRIDTFCLSAQWQARSQGLKTLQRFRSDGSTKLKKPSASGLHLFLSAEEVEGSLGVLDSMLEAKSVKAMENILGQWWYDLYMLWAQRKNKNYWIEERSTALKHHDFLNRLFKTPQWIYMMRDPRDIASAIALEESERFRYAPTESDWKNRLHEIVQNMKVAQDIIQVMPENQVLVLRFEDFTQKPEECMDRVLNYLGMEYDAAVLPQNINFEAIQGCKDFMTDSMKAYANKHFKKYLKDWGYA